MKTIILHFGIHKTASSSIQNSMLINQNKEKLAAEGIHIFESLPANHSGLLITCFRKSPENYYPHKINNRTIDEINKIKFNYLSLLSQEIRNSDKKYFWISGEDGCVLTEEELRKLKSFFESIESEINFKVFYLTRDPLTYLKSAIQQNVKGNNLTITSSANKIIRSSRNMYKSLFERLSNVFGEENVNTFCFEDVIKHKDRILEHLFSCLLGLNVSLISKMFNVSISDYSVIIINYLRETGSKVRQEAFNSESYKDDSFNFIELSSSRGKDVIKDYSLSVKNDIQHLKDQFGIQYHLDIDKLGENLNRFLAKLKSENEGNKEIQKLVNFYESQSQSA